MHQDLGSDFNFGFCESDSSEVSRNFVEAGVDIVARFGAHIE